MEVYLVLSCCYKFRVISLISRYFPFPLFPVITHNKVVRPSDIETAARGAAIAAAVGVGVCLG